MKEFESLFEYYGFTKSDEKKYPVISGILKELTPERIEKEIKEVQEVKLPGEIKKWTKEYERVGDRNPFIWKWLYKSFKVAHLPIIPKKFEKSLLIDKLLITIFITILNDAGDKQNKKLLKKLIKIPFSRSVSYNELIKKDESVVIFVNKLWNFINKRLKKYPKYNEFKEIFYYDLGQVINGINYSSLVNNNLLLINKIEYWAYISHKMMVMVYSMMDLMASPNFNKKELGRTREVALYAQRMARIGNWVSTWEREIHEKDYTSGIFAYAINNKIIGFNDLTKKNKENIIKKIKKIKVEKELLKNWENNYNIIKESCSNVSSFHIDEFLQKLKEFIVFHLTSKNYK